MGSLGFGIKFKPVTLNMYFSLSNHQQYSRTECQKLSSTNTRFLPVSLFYSSAVY